MFGLFRSFLPLLNPIGFGAADFIELFIALVLLGFAAGLRSRLQPLALRFAERTVWCMALLAILPVALRLVLLPHHPVPTPDIYDEFSHLLVADTLRHFRLANPPHAMSQFFETFFVLQRPTYSSIYPLGQGLMLAIGWTIFGLPWAGVLLATACFCSLVYWMLRGWTTPGWALTGGLLAVMEFGPLNQWMNSYWGGMLAASAGCLVFGALPRLQKGRQADAVLLGLGLAIHLLTRPFESLFLLLVVAAWFLPALKDPAQRPVLAKSVAAAAIVFLPAVALTLAQNRQVTGSWTTLPYNLSQYEYGVPTSLTIQPNPVPHRDLTPEQQLDYRMQTSFRPAGGESFRTYIERMEYRVRFYRFFFLVPLYFAALAFLTTLREFRLAWVAGTLLLFALGINFFPAFQLHYLAAVTCLFLLVCVTGLDRMSRWTLLGQPAGREVAGVILSLCVAHFLFWYGAHLFDAAETAPELLAYETWDNINHNNPARRISIRNELDRIPGQLLVFVRYAPRHQFQEEWVWNAADIDFARIVWARDLGPDADQELIRAYPGRRVLLFEPDARPMQLNTYPQ